MARQKESKRRAVCNPLTISTKENRKRKVSYDTPIADLLHGKIIIKIYLSENKEVTLLVKLNR